MSLKIPEPIFGDYPSLRPSDVRLTDAKRNRLKWVQQRIYEMSPNIEPGTKKKVIDALVAECKQANGRGLEPIDMYEIVNAYMHHRSPDFSNRVGGRRGGGPRLSKHGKPIGRPRKMTANSQQKRAAKRKTVKTTVRTDRNIAHAATLAEKATRLNIPKPFVNYLEDVKAKIIVEGIKHGLVFNGDITINFKVASGFVEKTI